MWWGISVIKLGESTDVSSTSAYVSIRVYSSKEMYDKWHFFNESPTERFIGEDIFIRAIFKIKMSDGERV